MQICDISITDSVLTIVCDILSSLLSSYGIPWYKENLLDIEYQIKNSISKQGIVATVMTPKLTFVGVHSGKDLAWQVDELVLQVVEFPPTNRASSKLSSITALDLVLRASDVLTSPLGQWYNSFEPVSIEQTEDGGLLVAKAILKTYACTDLSSYPSPVDPTKRLHFITDEMLSAELSNYLKKEDLSADISSILSSYATKSYVDSNVSSISADLKNKRGLSDLLYTEEYTYNSVASTSDALPEIVVFKSGGTKELLKKSSYYFDLGWSDEYSNIHIGYNTNHAVWPDQLKFIVYLAFYEGSFTVDYYQTLSDTVVVNMSSSYDPQDVIQLSIDIYDKYTNIALSTDIPTKTSQLQNDIGYVTSSQLSSSYASKADLASTSATLSNYISSLEYDVSTQISVLNSTKRDYLDRSYDLLKLSGASQISSFEAMSSNMPVISVEFWAQNVPNPNSRFVAALLMSVVQNLSAQAVADGFRYANKIPEELSNAYGWYSKYDPNPSISSEVNSTFLAFLPSQNGGGTLVTWSGYRWFDAISRRNLNLSTEIGYELIRLNRSGSGYTFLRFVNIISTDNLATENTTMYHINEVSAYSTQLNADTRLYIDQQLSGVENVLMLIRGVQ